MNSFNNDEYLKGRIEGLEAMEQMFEEILNRANNDESGDVTLEYAIPTGEQ